MEWSKGTRVLLRVLLFSSPKTPVRISSAVNNSNTLAIAKSILSLWGSICLGLRGVACLLVVGKLACNVLDSFDLKLNFLKRKNYNKNIIIIIKKLSKLYFYFIFGFLFI